MLRNNIILFLTISFFGWGQSKDYKDSEVHEDLIIYCQNDTLLKVSKFYSPHKSIKVFCRDLEFNFKQNTFDTFSKVLISYKNKSYEAICYFIEEQESNIFLRLYSNYDYCFDGEYKTIKFYRLYTSSNRLILVEFTSKDFLNDERPYLGLKSVKIVNCDDYK